MPTYLHEAADGEVVRDDEGYELQPVGERLEVGGQPHVRHLGRLRLWLWLGAAAQS